MNTLVFSEKIEYALGWAVIHSLWQATTIALLWGVGLVVLRKKSAQLRYLLVNACLLTVLIASVITFAWYYQKAKPDKVQSTDNQEYIAHSPTLTPVVVTPVPMQGTPLKQINWWYFQQTFEQYLPLIVMGWMLGMVFFMLRWMGSISYTFYLRRRVNFQADEYWIAMLERLAQRAGITKGIELLESAMVRSPLLIGYLKPAIMFPLGMINRMPASEVEAILAHELAHILRKDYLFNTLQGIIEALFYYHPAVWWLSGQVRDERESACDEMAIQLLDGNTMSYAKALVAVQEMAYFPLSTTLAFAGQGRKNQLLMRIQRILNINQNNTNAMEKTIAICLVGLSLAGLLYGQQSPQKLPTNGTKQSQTQSVTATIDDSWQGVGSSGFWLADIEGDHIQLQLSGKFEGGNWNTSETFLKTEFSALPTQEGEFKVIRPAGTIHFKGKFENNEGYGRFTFVANDSFKEYLNAQNIKGVTDADLMFCFMSNMDKNFIETLQSLKIKHISREDLQQLAIFRITPKDLKGFHKILTQHSDKPITVEAFTQLKIHNISEEYAQALAHEGFKNLDAEKLMMAKIHEITPEYIREVKKRIKNIDDIEDIVQLKIQGVDAAFSDKMKAFYQKDLDKDELMNAKIHELDKMDLQKLKSLGYNDLTPEDLTNFSIHGINPDFIESINKSGMGHLSPEDLVNVKIHEISADFIKDFKDLGYELSLEQALTAKIQGITPTFVKGFIELGFKNLTIDELMSAKIQGITPEYIKKKREKGYQMPALNDYINMKIMGAVPQYPSTGALPPLPPSAPMFEANNRAMRNSQRQLNRMQSELQAQQQALEARSQEMSQANHRIERVARKNKNISDLLKTMANDGIIKIGEKVKVHFTNQSLTINDKAANQATFQRYHDLAEKHLGRSINDEDYFRFEGIIKEVRGDSFTCSGRFEMN